MDLFMAGTGSPLRAANMPPRSSSYELMTSRLIGFAIGFSLLTSGVFGATIVHYPGGGHDAIGGTVTVTYGDNTVKVGIIDGVDPLWDVLVPGFFELAIPINSATGAWILDNLRPVSVTGGAAGLDIIKLEVDLTGTHALFDTETQTNTPGSGPGHVGGQFFPGQVYNGHYPQQSLSSVWSDPINQGDLFLVSTKIFEPNQLQANGPGLNWSVGWSQDLDVWSDDAASAPEPGTLGMSALVLTGLCAIRRRARARVRP
jgi:hypothetical protein